MTSDAGSPCWGTDWDVLAYAAWRASSRPIRFSAGIAGWWPGKWTYSAATRADGPACSRRIRQLVVRMANENPTWGFTRMQGALKVVGHRVGRSTIARILRAHGLAPVPERPSSWQTFLRGRTGARLPEPTSSRLKCGPRRDW